MAHENMLNAKYEYGDEDVNAVVKYVRKNTKTPQDSGTHVVILDTIASDEAKETGARSFAATLNKHTRLNTTDYLIALNHLLIELNPVTVAAVSDFMEKNYARLDKKVKESVVNRLGFSDGTKTELSHEEKETLQKAVKKEVDQGTGEDAFDVISKTIKNGDSKFLILFPYNLGNYHWVLGEIEIERRGNNISVQLVKYDSLADRDSEFKKREYEEFIAVIDRRLKEMLGEGTFNFVYESVTATNKKTQNDNKSCGAFTCHNLSLRAQGKPALNDSIPAGAQALRQKQYDMLKPKSEPAVSVTPAKISGDSKWTPVLEKQLHDAYPDIFKNVKNAKLKDHTVETTDLTDKNLEEFVKSTKALMQKLGFDGEVEVNAPADKKQKLIELCKLHKIKLAGETKSEPAKPAPAKVEPERMDKAEPGVSRSPVRVGA